MVDGFGFTAETPVGQQLYRRLRQRVLIGELRPGERLSESEMAQVYGVSRQPVREAFIRMAGDGLVEIRPQRGSFIRRISERDVLAARLIREAVEVDLLRLAVEADCPSLGQDMLTQIAWQRAAAEDHDHERFLALDDDFHRLIAQAVGQEHVWTELEGVKAQMDRLRYLSTRRADLAVTLEDHRLIAEAISAGDVVAGGAAMRRHLRRALDDLPLIRQEQPEYFID